MSSIQLVREQVIGFDHQGQTVVTDEYFIKLKVGFRRFARQFKGARLCFFLEVAFQEADIHILGAQPLTIPEVCELWDISRRSVVDAVEYLVSNNFIVKVGVRGNEDPHRGAYMYRPSAFAWFGAGIEQPPSAASDRYANFAHLQDSDSPMQNLHSSPAVQIPNTAMQNPPRDGSENAHLVCKKPRGGVQNPTGPMQNAPNHIVDDIGTKHKGTNKKQKARDAKSKPQLEMDVAENLARSSFRSFGIGGINLSRLSKLVSPQTAEDWATYARHTDKPRDMVQGICFNSLMSDPTAPPPCSDADLARWRSEETRSAEKKAVQLEYERKVASGEIEVKPEPPARVHAENFAQQETFDTDAAHLWTAACGELQLQMTKATFDTWVKPTFGLSWDSSAAKLSIGVRNAYAKQWLENRLYGMVERTLNHVAGRPVEISFVLKNREQSEPV